MCGVFDSIGSIIKGAVNTVISPIEDLAHGDFGSLLTDGIKAGGLLYGGYGLTSGLAGLGAGVAGSAGSAASELGSGTLSGLGTAGAAEAGSGGSALFGTAAGTGTALGDSTLGSGLVNTASAVGSNPYGFTSGLGGLGSLATDTGSALGGITDTSGLGSVGGIADGTGASGGGSLSGGVGAGSTGATDLSGTSLQNGVTQAASNSGDTQGLSTLYAPNSANTGSVMGNAVQSAGTTGQVGVNQFTAPSAWDNISNFYNTTKPYVNLASVINSGYQKYQQGKAAQNQLDQINSLYAPNSAYAQQMQQELARKDAAAGRNSQYGSRAVQLAAALTQAKSQALTSQAYGQAGQNAATSGTSLLNGLYSLYGMGSTAPKVASDINSAWQGLSGLFS